MAKKFLNKKTHRFYFVAANGKRRSYVLTFGDEVNIPLLNHPQITVTNIYHNGIGQFDSGFNTDIGNRANDRLTTLHDSTADLDGLDLASGHSAVFGDWIQAVNSNTHYQRFDQSHGVIDVGDPDITVDIIGPVLELDGQSLKWLGNKSHTINGHVFKTPHHGSQIQHRTF